MTVNSQTQLFQAADGKVEDASVVRKFRITAADGKTYITLMALALLVAESKPDQKELIIRLIQQFILLKDAEL